MSGGLWSAYPRSPRDEMVAPDGRLRNRYAALAAELDRLGPAGLATAAAALEAQRSAQGVTVPEWIDGRPRSRPLAMDPLPRLLPAEEWERVSVGVAQRHRALNAFLADVYRAAGRRRDDPDRAPELVRAGVLPEWAVSASPARDPGAVALAWPGQQRAGLAASELVRNPSGRWLVCSDELKVPSGLAHALVNRAGTRAALPGLLAAARPTHPESAVPMLRAALEAAAPPGVPGLPRCGLLGGGDPFEDRLLGEALGLAVLRPADLRPRPDGGIEARVDGAVLAVDVLARRVPDSELSVHRTGFGEPLAGLLTEAVRSGRLGLVNVPGNGLADDPATFPWVPAMIRFYLDEEPVLESVPTWVLADDDQWAQVRNRLHELVLAPLATYGGGSVVVGPSCSAAELAQLQAEVAAAPHRFVAREPVAAGTLPTLVDGVLLPRPVGLRVFSVTANLTQAVPAPLTTVLGPAGEGSGQQTKDTWLLP